MARIPDRSEAVITTTGRCEASSARFVRAWVKRRRTQHGSPWVRSSSVPLRTGCQVEGYTERAPEFSGGSGSQRVSGPAVTSDTLVVDIAPEFAVVVGVGGGYLSAMLLHGGAIQIQFGNVGIEQFDVRQDPVGVDDDAPHRRAVAVACLQRG